MVSLLDNFSFFKWPNIEQFDHLVTLVGNQML